MLVVKYNYLKSNCEIQTWHWDESTDYVVLAEVNPIYKFLPTYFIEQEYPLNSLYHALNLYHWDS